MPQHIIRMLPGCERIFESSLLEFSDLNKVWNSMDNLVIKHVNINWM